MILFVGVPFAVMAALLCWEAIQARADRSLPPGTERGHPPALRHAATPRENIPGTPLL
jgi:hypothetical protein